MDKLTDFETSKKETWGSGRSVSDKNFGNKGLGIDTKIHPRAGTESGQKGNSRGSSINSKVQTLQNNKAYERNGTALSGSIARSSSATNSKAANEEENEDADLERKEALWAARKQNEERRIEAAERKNQEISPEDGIYEDPDSMAPSMGKKIGGHKSILLLAVVFDIIGLIPIVSVATNFFFGLILFLNFGSKKKAQSQSGLTGVVLPIAIGSAFDLFLSFVSVCIGATIIRIVMAKD